MIKLRRTYTETIYLTLSEYQNAPSTYYFFKFTNRLTGQEVLLTLEDISTNEYYQKFEIDVSEFDNKDSGFYTYEVWQSNVNEEIIGDRLESGYAVLYNSTTFTPDGYSEQLNTFKTYNGQ
jgi:hypothetical protein